MKEQDVHIVNMVSIGNKEYLVDAGYAAPFYKALPLGLKKDYIMKAGNYTYVLKAAPLKENTVMQMYYKNEMIHGYTINPLSREIFEFIQIIRESFNSNATFMNTLLLTRFDGEYFLRLENNHYSESNERVTREYTLVSQADLIDLIRDRFGIAANFSSVCLSEIQLI